MPSIAMGAVTHHYTIYEITKTYWAVFGLPLGTLLKVMHDSIPITGDLVAALVNGHHFLGFWFPAATGSSWLIEPHRMIEITPDTPFRLLGCVAPLCEFTTSTFVSLRKRKRKGRR